MRFLRFRYILPIANVILASWIFLGQKAIAAIERDSSTQATQWDLRAADGPPPISQEILAAIDFPALVLVVVPLVVVSSVWGDDAFSGLENWNWSAYALLGFAGICIVLQWYVVGMWIDRRCDLLPRPAIKASGFAKFLVFFIATVLALLFVVLGVLDASHPGMYTRGGRGIGIAFWSGLGSIWLISRLRHHLAFNRQRTPEH